MPLGIIVLGFLVLLSGFLSLIWGAALTAFGGASWLTGLIFSDSIQAWGGSAFASGLWSLVVGVVQLITAAGLFARQRWAWLVAVISTALALITPFLSLLHGSLWGLVGLIIPALIFSYLLHDQDVKRTF